MSPPLKNSSLARGLDSGEYVFSNPKQYMNQAKGVNEMRDSAGHSD